jgi:hypothetical protein
MTMFERLERLEARIGALEAEPRFTLDGDGELRQRIEEMRRVQQELIDAQREQPKAIPVVEPITFSEVWTDSCLLEEIRELIDATSPDADGTCSRGQLVTEVRAILARARVATKEP